VLPAIANYDLARAYYYHLIDVEKTNELIRAGLALHTYGDIEYGYQLHDMYTEQQAVRLTGQDRLEAYEMAKEVLIKNYERYPYDARTAIFLAHVLDSAPPEVSPDSAFLKGVVDRALALSPKRAQTWYVRANLSIGLAKDLPPGPKKTERYQEAIGTLEEYIALVPTISEPHYVLADLYFAIGDKERADREAAKGDLYYKENVGAARRAALYYERTQDWEKAALYLQRVVDEDETDFIFYYDLAKVNYMLGDFDDALRIVQDLRVRNPTILPTDQNFLAAITIYEQSTH
jgi:tetratricopeptide (TPR) repeat protein